MKGEKYPDFVERVSSDPLAQLERHLEQGRKVMGYMCSYVPEELVYGAGFLPFRLLGRATQITRSDQHLQTYCCSHVRGFFEDFLSGRYEGLRGVLFAHTCDTMQGFYDIFRFNNPELFTRNMNFPSRIDGILPLQYALKEYMQFRGALEAFAGDTISDAALEDAVAVYDRTRRLLAELYSLHASNPDLLPSVILLRSVLTAMFVDKREFNDALDCYLAECRGKAEGDPGTRKRLLLIGSVNINEELYELTDLYGGTVVDDDLCTGRRYFQGLVGAANDEALLRRYFERPHCPAKHRTNTARGEYLLGLARDQRVDAAVFVQLKFCDPHAFDYPYLKETLERAGLRTHLIEMDQSVPSSGQLETKIQAFMESLQ